jgi:hypothetical protein
MPRWGIAAIAGGGLLALCCAGTIAIAVTSKDDDGGSVDTATSVRPLVLPTVTTASPPAVTTAPTSVAPSSPKAAVPTVTQAAPAEPALPANRTYEGRGAKVVRVNLSEDYLHIASITHKGSSNFVVQSIGEDGDDLDLLVNEIGSYSGVRLLDAEGTPKALKVEADGRWTMTVKVALKAPVWDGNATGRGDAVLRVESAQLDFTTVALTHRGSSNFVVEAYGDSSDLLVNEIGRYSGETILPDGTVLVAISADGAWTFKKT